MNLNYFLLYNRLSVLILLAKFNISCYKFFCSIQFLFFYPKEDTMKLSAPKTITFIIAIVLAVLGLLGSLGVISALGTYAFWLVFAAFVLLALGNLLSGL